MPDAVMMLAYPAAKPLDAKGYVTRLHAAVDTLVALVPEAVVCATEQTAALGRGDPAPSAAAGDLGRVDAATLREYVAVGGTNYRLFAQASYSGPVAEPVIRFHAKMLTYNMKYRVTVTQTSGTLRSFPYSFVLEVMGTV